MESEQGLGRGAGEALFIGIEFQFCKMKKVLEMDGGDGYTTVWLYLVPLNCTLKMVKMANYVYFTTILKNNF